jgi:hypothetical protein
VVARKRAASQKKSVGKALTTNVRQTADADRANAFVEFREKKTNRLPLPPVNRHTRPRRVAVAVSVPERARHLATQRVRRASPLRV